MCRPASMYVCVCVCVMQQLIGFCVMTAHVKGIDGQNCPQISTILFCLAQLKLSSNVTSIPVLMNTFINSCKKIEVS